MLDDFIKLVTRQNSLFHFTDATNIKSIRQHGLLSYSLALRKGVAVAKPGGNDWSHEADERRGLDEYVHLSLTDNHPMLFRAKEENRITNPVHIRIDPEILRFPGIKMTLDVSNKAGVAVHDLIDALPHVDGEILFTRMDWKVPAIGQRRRSADKYEILIPNEIAVAHLRIPYGS